MNFLLDLVSKPGVGLITALGALTGAFMLVLDPSYFTASYTCAWVLAHLLGFANNIRTEQLMFVLNYLDENGHEHVREQFYE